jgi:hypothetical protein
MRLKRSDHVCIPTLSRQAEITFLKVNIMQEMMSPLPLILLQIPVAIWVGFMAPKINRNKVLWIIISIIPIVGFIAAYVFFFIWMGYITDVLNNLKSRQ